MELRIDEAQLDIDAPDLYEDLREEDMLEILGLMHTLEMLCICLTLHPASATA